MKNALVPFLVLLLIGTSGSAFYFYTQASASSRDPQLVAKKEADSLVAQVGKLILLPSEQPTVATITEPEKLKDQVFFAHAQVGDKVLIYANARKAILFNPTQNRLVEVAPLVIGEGSQQTQVQSQPAQVATSTAPAKTVTKKTTTKTN